MECESSPRARMVGANGKVANICQVCGLPQYFRYYLICMAIIFGM